MFSKSFFISLIFLLFYRNVKTSSFISTLILIILIAFTLYDLCFHKKKKLFKENIVQKNNNYVFNNVHENVYKKINEEEQNEEEQNEEEQNEEENIFIKNLSLHIISHFHLHPENYKSIYKLLLTQPLNLHYCNYLFILFLHGDNLSINIKLDIANFIIWNSSNQDHIDFIYSKIVELSQSSSYSSNIRSIAIDMLMRSNNTKYINTSAVLLERLRNEERKINENNNIRSIHKQILQIQQIPVINEEDIQLQHILINNLQRRQNDIIQNQNRKATIYNDSQNVHTHEINNSVLNSLNSPSLQSSSNSIIIIEDELKQHYLDYDKHKLQIETTLNKINTDQTTFKNNMKLSSIFNKIVNFISNSKYKPDMIKRLGEELVEMHGLCTTGHMTRLLNVIQGYPDVPDDLKIKINPKDEIYATINTYLSSEIQKSDNYEQLLDDMIIMNKNFINFIVDKMKIKVKDLQKDYNNIIDKDTLKLNIEDSLIQYLKNENVVKNIMKEII